MSAKLDGMLADALAQSPRARELCVALEGKRLKITPKRYPTEVWVLAHGGALHVSGAAPGVGDPVTGTAPQADVSLSGTVLALLELAGGNAPALVASGRVSIDGDEHIAWQFQQLAALLRPNFEALFARVVGRVPAHVASRALHAVTAWGRQAKDSVLRNGAEYLAHESRDLVPRAEAESFLSGVEALHKQVLNAEARVAKLAERLAQPPAS